MTDDAADSVPACELGPATTQVGDIWLLGPHRLICGDARLSEVYAALMGDDRARDVFTDPPFDVKIDGHACGSGAVKHCEFAMASGEMDAATFIAFLQASPGAMSDVSQNRVILFVCMN